MLDGPNKRARTELTYSEENANEDIQASEHSSRNQDVVIYNVNEYTLPAMWPTNEEWIKTFVLIIIMVRNTTFGF